MEGFRLGYVPQRPFVLSGTLEENILKIRAGDAPPKSLILYIGTCGQNPTGHTYSRERLRDLYEMTRKYDVIIIEDDSSLL